MNSRQIDHAKPGDVLWDDQVRGLHVRVFPTKTAFYLRYNTKAGQYRRPKLGNYGSLSLAAAREIARDKLYAVSKGEDPDANRGPQPTVTDLKKKFMDEHASKRKFKTKEMYRSIWKHADPLLKIPVIEVTRKDVSDLHHKMRQIPVQANRTLAVLHKAFNLAEIWGWRSDHSNPVRGIERYKEQKRRRYPDVDEGIRLIRALDEFDHPIFVGYIWLVALTGARTSEIRTAQRAWVKSTGLHLPDTKTGESIKPLPKPAREIIANLPVVKGNPYLIPGHKKGQPLVGTKKLWRRLLVEADIKGLQMRDLRRYFASLAISGGLTLETVGQLLGHTQSQTTKVYAYLLTDAATRAAEAAAAQLVRVRKIARRRVH